MTAPTIGGSAVPTTLASNGVYGGGQYKFLRQEERQAADGSLYYAGLQSAEWTWVGMGSVEYDWWRTQWQRGTAMPCELWQDDTRRAAVSFSSARLLRPEHKYIEAGLYREVTIKLTHLLPLVS